MSRKPNYPIADIILNRWSPRAMSGELITHDQLMTIFEAARWAPSSFNNQPWRFLYATRNSKYWDLFLGLLVEKNKVWCQRAAVLVVTISKKIFDYDGRPSRTHSFDAGAAWENAALQGTLMGLVVHGMEGFDYDRAQKELYVPDDYTVEMMFAIGHHGDTSLLPPEMQKGETMNDRRPLSEIVIEGTWK